MYRSYSVSNMPEPVNRVADPPKPVAKPIQKPEKKEPTSLIAENFKSDDLILLIVIAILIFNECNDKLLLLALVYIFFSDYFNR